MKTLKASVALPESRQLRLLFETGRLSGLSAAERSKIRLALAQILMQAGGLIVEEVGDDGR
jgi:hypothetical protein